MWLLAIKRRALRTFTGVVGRALSERATIGHASSPHGQAQSLP
jgi:hypothetical protein